LSPTRPPSDPPPPEPPRQPRQQPHETPATLWVIDGYNVLRVSFSQTAEEAARARGLLPAAGSPLSDGPSLRQDEETEIAGRRGWWVEPRRRALVELAGRACAPGESVWVVFDGARGAPGTSEAAPEGAGRAGVVFAPSADDWIVRTVKQRHAGAGASPATRTIVVTADRPLAGRCRHHGAECESPAVFVKRCLEESGA